MKITDVNISGLWGCYSIEWKLNKDVTILSGINGSGKSTMLRAMAALLQGKPLPDSVATRLKEISITFDSGHILTLTVFLEDMASMEERAKNDRIFSAAFQDLKKKYSERIEEGRASIVSSQRLGVTDREGNRVNIKEFLKQIHTDFISTFDCAPTRPDDPNEYLKYILNSSYSELDRHLDAVVERYRSYQIELSSRMAQMMSEIDTKEGLDDVRKLSSKKLMLQDTMDRLLKDSGKRVNREKGEVEFIFNSDNSSHSYKTLSAGEKQLLLILLTVFMQEDNKAILIMDEPEISLHVDWQRQLIDIIRKLNSDCQIIVSTHSPAMILNGWQPAIDNISDLAKQE